MSVIKNNFYTWSSKIGISLITLVITIIVIIILAGAVILTLAQNNPIDSAREAVFKQDVSSYKDELILWKSKQYVDTLGSFNPILVNKSGQLAKDEGIISFKKEHINKFEIREGELVYVGTDPDESDWFNGVIAEPTDPTEDELPPQDAIISVTFNNGTIVGTITVKDNESGIDYSKTKYIVTITNTPYNAEDVIWGTSDAKNITQATQSISETEDSGEYYIQVLSVDKGDNKKVTVSDKITLVGIMDPGYNSEQGVNGPVLNAGMIPVKWIDNSMVETTTNDSAWYNYTNKQWANAISKDESGNITAYWVWIPRYEYKIPTPHQSTEQTIDVNFMNGTGSVATSGYTIHPAFTFGSTELKGIWIAKFEATASEGVGGSESADNVTTKNVKVVPGVKSWRYIQIGNMFDVCRKMEINSTYGWGTSGSGIDTHLMKNVEWGAVVYLSSSIYGKTGEIQINNSIYYTGGGVTESEYITVVGQSTTGNVYGVYDMSGGAWEYTAAYVNNGTSSIETYGFNLVNADIKYRDVYASDSGNTASGNYALTSDKKGDAVYETSASSNSPYSNSWYRDYSYMPQSISPFFIRGGFYNGGSVAGAFAFYYNFGNVDISCGFRPVLTVDASL